AAPAVGRARIDAFREPDLERRELTRARARSEDADPTPHTAEPAAQHAVTRLAARPRPRRHAKPLAPRAAERDAPPVVRDDGHLAGRTQPRRELVALQRRNEVARATHDVPEQGVQPVAILE